MMEGKCPGEGTSELTEQETPKFQNQNHYPVYEETPRYPEKTPETSADDQAMPGNSRTAARQNRPPFSSYPLFLENNFLIKKIIVNKNILHLIPVMSGDLFSLLIR